MTRDMETLERPHEKSCGPKCGQQAACEAFLPETCSYLSRAAEKPATLRAALKNFAEGHFKYELIYHSMPNAVLMADTETGIIVEANAKAAELLGRPVSEIVGMHQKDLHPAEDRDRYEKLFKDCASGCDGSLNNGDCYVCRKDGERIPVEIRYSLVSIGDRTNLCAIFTDLRKQKELLADIEAGQERYKRLTEVAFEAIVIHEQGKFIDANQQCLDLFGFTLDEMKNGGVYPIIAPESLELMKEKAASGYTGTYEAFGRKKDGTVFPIQVGVKEALLDGRPVRIAAIRDLTSERQQIEQLKAVLESLHDCFLVWDKDHNYLYANRAAMEYAPIEPVTGHPETIIGRNMRAMMTHIPDFAELWIGRIDEVFKSGKPLRVTDMGPIGGMMVYSESVLSPLRYPNGEIFAVGLVYRDVTEQKRMEQEVAASEKKYRALYDHAQVALYRTRASDGKLLECNHAMANLLGYKNKEECLAECYSARQYVDPEQRKELLRRLEQEGCVSGFQVEIRRKDGQHIWVELAARLFAEEGYLEGTQMDITASKVLTPSEKQVLDLILQGYSNKEVAKMLGRSVRTIEDHRSHIMRKLNADNLVELIQNSKFFKNGSPL